MTHAPKRSSSPRSNAGSEYAKPRFVVMEHAMTSTGREMSERREVHLSRSVRDEERIKVLARITREIDRDKVVFRVIAVPGRAPEVKERHSLADRSREKFQSDWDKYWIPSLPQDATPTMKLVASIDPVGGTMRTKEMREVGGHLSEIAAEEEERERTPTKGGKVSSSHKKSKTDRESSAHDQGSDRAEVLPRDDGEDEGRRSSLKKRERSSKERRAESSPPLSSGEESERRKFSKESEGHSQTKKISSDGKDDSPPRKPSKSLRDEEDLHLGKSGTEKSEEEESSLGEKKSFGGSGSDKSKEHLPVGVKKSLGKSMHASSKELSKSESRESKVSAKESLHSEKKGGSSAGTKSDSRDFSVIQVKHLKRVWGSDEYDDSDDSEGDKSTTFDIHRKRKPRQMKSKSEIRRMIEEKPKHDRKHFDVDKGTTVKKGSVDRPDSKSESLDKENRLRLKSAHSPPEKKNPDRVERNTAMSADAEIDTDKRITQTDYNFLGGADAFSISRYISKTARANRGRPFLKSDIRRTTKRTKLPDYLDMDRTLSQNRIKEIDETYVLGDEKANKANTERQKSERYWDKEKQEKSERDDIEAQKDDFDEPPGDDFDSIPLGSEEKDVKQEEVEDLVIETEGAAGEAAKTKPADDSGSQSVSDTGKAVTAKIKSQGDTETAQVKAERTRDGTTRITIILPKKESKKDSDNDSSSSVPVHVEVDKNYKSDAGQGDDENDEEGGNKGIKKLEEALKKAKDGKPKPEINAIPFGTLNEAMGEKASPFTGDLEEQVLLALERLKGPSCSFPSLALMENSEWDQQRRARRERKWNPQTYLRRAYVSPTVIRKFADRRKVTFVERSDTSSDSEDSAASALWRLFSSHKWREEY